MFFCEGIIVKERLLVDVSAKIPADLPIIAFVLLIQVHHREKVLILL